VNLREVLKRRIVENTHENCSEKQEEKCYLLLPHSCEEFSKKSRLGKNYDEMNTDIVLFHIFSTVQK